MCADPGSFESLKRIPKLKKITMGNGFEEDTYGEGTIIINPSMTLEEVLYVPTLVMNLCSLRKRDRDGYMAIIGDGEIAIYTDEILVIKGRDTRNKRNWKRPIYDGYRRTSVHRSHGTIIASGFMAYVSGASKQGECQETPRYGKRSIS